MIDTAPVWDVELSIGKYAGAILNQKPLTKEEAKKLADGTSQRGRPMIRLNDRAFIEALNQAEE